MDPDKERVFRSWVSELHYLFIIEIPRWIGFDFDDDDLEKWSLHTFCDASGKAYAAVVFLRKVQHNEVSIHLLAAKTRVAPLKKMTIPRLELMSATIGARLCKSVQDCLNHKMETVLWSDSSTVISWIRRKDDWSPFVGNRVSEIRSLTSSESWRHVPGNWNPIPSRGCSDEEWHMTYFSSYTKTLRMVGWIFRFIHNVRNPKGRHRGPLTTEEINLAEIFVFKLIQQDTFTDERDKQISALSPFGDNDGVEIACV